MDSIVDSFFPVLSQIDDEVKVLDGLGHGLVKARNGDAKPIDGDNPTKAKPVKAEGDNLSTLVSGNNFWEKAFSTLRKICLWTFRVFDSG